MDLLDLILPSLGFVLGITSFYLYSRRSKPINLNISYLQSLWEVEKLILENLNFTDIAEKITNTILNELGYLKLGYEIVVLALIDKQRGTLKRVSISKTEGAQKFLSTTPVPFGNIEISLNEDSNISIRALKENRVMFTESVSDILYPVVSDKYVKALQNELGIKCSMVVPVSINNDSFGILIFSVKKSQSEISEREQIVIHSFTQAVAISIQNATLFSSLRKTSEKLLNANQKLEVLDKLKDDFVSIASHELRTPMTAIRSYAWMALNRSDVPLSEKMKKYLSRVLISTERLINLVNDMLNISRIESGRVEIVPQPFDLLTLSKDVLSEVEQKASEKSLHLNLNEAITIPKVFADPDKVHQVLLNLVGNSLKFTPTDGTIDISFFTDGQVVETRVKDTGTGITKEDLGRLFKKFGRLDNSYVAAATSGGTGLGLYICKSLIDLMGGKIWATSEGLGKGSSFIFSLPVATAQNIADAAKYTKKAEGEAKPLEPVAI